MESNRGVFKNASANEECDEDVFFQFDVLCKLWWMELRTN